ncbi:MAG: sigma 54-interacting transcriptional regulator [Spirochaetaceae bacterium]|nr:sigma 54-interacting transcriptional regulator [Spirochaetaceae bacterium]
MRRKQPANARVLIVDDQKDIHEDFEEMLRPRPMAAADDPTAAFLSHVESDHHLPAFELLHAMGGEEACALLAREAHRKRPIAAAYVDIRMPPGIDGVATVRSIRRIDRAIEIVLMTAYTDTPLADIVQDMELLHKLLYIRKPFAREEIQQITLALVEKWNLEQELAAGRRQLTITNQRLTAVLDSIGEAIAVCDDAQRLVFANRYYQRMMASTEEEMKALTSQQADALWETRMRKVPLTDVGSFLTSDAGGELVELVEQAEPAAGADRSPRKYGAPGPMPGGRLYSRQHRPVHDDRGRVVGDLYVYRDLAEVVAIEQMQAEVRSLRETLESAYSFDGIEGSSVAMQRVYALMKRAMEVDITVLVRGESGTGKELVAKALHFNGARCKGPFMAVNCAAVPEAMIESELFGHEQGAFTGATSSRIGYFERAHGGTILLDEIADMNPALQAKLLRVLQERELQRVGGTTTIPVDVRVIAATNRDLEAAMRAGEFREDLYFRLASFPIVIPPLRERREDIPQLVNHFLKRHAERNGEPVKRISPGAIGRLLAYDWPGNIRELSGVIERAALVDTTGTIHAAALTSHLRPARPERGVAEESGAPTKVLQLDIIERQAVLQALKASAHNVTRAAHTLGISRATLHRKLKKYGLSARARGD